MRRHSYQRKDSLISLRFFRAQTWFPPPVAIVWTTSVRRGSRESAIPQIRSRESVLTMWVWPATAKCVRLLRMRYNKANRGQVHEDEVEEDEEGWGAFVSVVGLLALLITSSTLCTNWRRRKEKRSWKIVSKQRKRGMVKVRARKKRKTDRQKRGG